jgi:4-diphosphocytidyl-2-C-methyl-D-erythritol kinase
LPPEPGRAKINLFLHVTGRRADGYHLLDSLAAFAGAADSVAFAPPAIDGDFSLSLVGPFGAGLAAEPDNLVLRAARLLRDAAGTSAGAMLELHKALPIASGIGGGSADAAATLRLLARAWNIDAAHIDLPALAVKLGADVPVCLAGRAARMSGIGEVLTDVPPLPEAGLLLVNPGVHVATPAVFRARTGPFSAPAELRPAWNGLDAFVEDLEATRNDLEAPAIALCPVIAQVLAALRALPGCRLARMSGSGATCFALFASAAAARDATAHLRHPEWWVHAGALQG